MSVTPPSYIRFFSSPFPCGSLSTHYNMRSFWWYDNFPFPLPLSHYTSLTTSLTEVKMGDGNGGHREPRILSAKDMSSGGVTPVGLIMLYPSEVPMLRLNLLYESIFMGFYSLCLILSVGEGRSFIFCFICLIIITARPVTAFPRPNDIMNGLSFASTSLRFMWHLLDGSIICWNYENEKLLLRVNTVPTRPTLFLLLRLIMKNPKEEEVK